MLSRGGALPRVFNDVYFLFLFNKGNVMSKEKIPNPWYVGVVSGMASYIDSAAIISNGTALVIYQKTIGITAVEIGILSGL